MTRDLFIATGLIDCSKCIEMSSSRRICIACGKPIKGKSSTLKLQITDEDPKLALNSKGLGFASTSWRRGDKMESFLHPQCFKIAKIVWQAAFNTRFVSPRRQ